MVDEEVRNIIAKAHAAEKILEKPRKMDELAEYLIEKERLLVKNL